MELYSRPGEAVDAQGKKPDVESLDLAACLDISLATKSRYWRCK
jgi:hypothetical protein